MNPVAGVKNNPIANGKTENDFRDPDVALADQDVVGWTEAI